MGQITINGQKVQVDDSFFRLSPEQQDATVDEIAGQMGASPQQAVPQPQQAAPSTGAPLPSGVIPGGAQVAFADQAIDAVPVAGPWLKDQLSNARAGLASGVQWLGDMTGLFDYNAPSKEQLDQFSQQSVASEPVAATAGSVFGTTAPFIVGGAIPGVSRLIGATGSLPSQMIFGGLTGAGITAADAAVRGADAKQTGEAGILGGVAGVALPAAARGLGRLFTGGVSREARNLGRALADDGINPATVDQQLQQMGPDAMVMDLGPNLQAQAGALASVPGQAQRTVRDAVAGRAAAASQRVEQDVAQTVGTGPEISALREQIVAGQKSAADPLYAAVRMQPVQPTGNLKFVFQTPMGKRALARAREIASNDGLPVKPGTVAVFDYAKQALDDIASVAKRQGENNTARQATQLATIIRKEVDAQVPGYRAAREAFAGPAQVLDAIETGQNIFARDMTPGQLQTMLGTMSQSERDAVLQGAQSNIAAMMGNAVNDVVSLRNWLRKGWNEQKLRILLGDQIADDLLQRVDRELIFGRTSNAVSSNSETARRMASQEEVAPELQRLQHPPQGFVGLVVAAINKARTMLRARVQPQANQRLAQALTSRQFSPQMAQQAQRSLLPRPGLPLPAPAFPLLEQRQ